MFCQLLDPGWHKGGHGTYNVDQDVKRLSLPLLHQLSRIMFRPLALLFFTKVPPKCFLTPWALHWVGYGCVCRDRLVFPWVLQELEHKTIISIAQSLVPLYLALSPASKHHAHPYYVQKR